MKKNLFAGLVVAASVMCVSTNAAEPAVYRPQLDSVSTEDVRYRTWQRRATRSYNRAQREFRRDYRDYIDDRNDFYRRSNRYRGSYRSPYRYYGTPRYYGPRNGVRFGNFGFYW